MCPPVHYGVEYVINPWMEGQHVDRDRALAQFQSLRRVYEWIGLKVELIDAEPGLPDMVFTANAGLMIGGRFVPSNFRYPERQPERAVFRRHFSSTGVEIVDLPPDLVFEGAGDALYVGDLLVLGYGFRSMRAVGSALSELAGCRRVLPVGLSNPYYYHLDTCFSPLPSGRFIYYPDAFDDDSREILQGMGGYYVTEGFCVRYGCNMVALDDVVVTTWADERLREIARLEKLTVIELDLSEFIKAGGGARCLSFFY